MARKAVASISPEELLASYSPVVRVVVQSLRELVQRAVPEATERAYPGWRAIGYRHPVAGYFCGIFPYEDRVDLAFEWGAYLPDPDKILEPGAGRLKQVRYIRFYEKENLDRQKLEKLLKIAVAFRG